MALSLLIAAFVQKTDVGNQNIHITLLEMDVVSAVLTMRWGKYRCLSAVELTAEGITTSSVESKLGFTQEPCSRNFRKLRCRVEAEFPNPFVKSFPFLVDRKLSKARPLNRLFFMPLKPPRLVAYY